MRNWAMVDGSTVWGKRKGTKTKKRGPPQEWPGKALQTHKLGVCPELTIRMTHERPVFASTEQGKKRCR